VEETWLGHSERKQSGMIDLLILKVGFSVKKNGYKKCVC